MKSEVGYRKCLWCAIILLSTSIFLLEPTAHAAAIVGHIGTPAGVPVQAVTVTATRTSPLQTLTDTTDSAGNYTLRTRFTDLSATYNVVPTKSGYTFNPASSNVTVRAAGPDETADFTTPASVPSATTLPPQSVSATSATLQGSVNPDGAATTAWFEYGLTASYGSASASTSAGNGTNAVPVSIGISGLLNGTNYHCRVVASNSFGVTVGNDLTFATLSGIPSVTTLVGTDGGAATMKLNGFVNPNGANANAWFEWGTTSGYGNTTAMQSVGGGGISTNFSQVLNGLTAGVTYHCRAVGSTTFGTSFGADVLFTPVFNDISAGLPGVYYSSVAWGDYDFDGRLDILLTGEGVNGPIAQVWRNTGSGLVNINAGLPGVYFSSVAWGDFNNDG